MSSIAALKGNAAGADQGKKEKTVKIKLTKEQRQYVDQLVTLDNRIAVCREYIQLWIGFFRFIAEDLDQRQITPKEEKAFFQITSQLARKQFMFVELMADKFERGPEIINVLGAATSLGMIQTMPEGTRAKFETDWHSLYLDMNKTLGRLLRELPGNMTLSEALASLNKAAPAPPASKDKKEAPAK